jgi:hypothetical protein
METMISIILWTVAIITGLTFLLQCINMAIVLWKGRGNAQISIINVAVTVTCLYLLTKL